MRKKGICILVCALLIGTTSIAAADWAPGDGHKMHFPQMPDPDGWDVDWGLVYLGDDWECSETGYVKDIHFWISWWYDNVQNIPWIYISIWSNNPVGPNGWSIPDQLLWEKTFQSGEFIVAGPWYGNQGWLNPPSQYYPNNHQKYYQINIIDIVDPFLQHESDVYWLVIKMPFNDQWICGWKTTLDHYLDNAVFATDPPTEWWLINGIDLAFVITGEPPKPDLDCDGDLRWLDVKPGDTVTGNFDVGNIGEPSSLLNWHVDTWPNWGSWSFSPSSGTGLPDGNWISVNATVVAPTAQNQNFTGKVKIVNSDDPSDYCEIDVYLQTPRSRFSFNSLLLRSLSRLFQQFPILEWLLYQQPNN